MIAVSIMAAMTKAVIAGPLPAANTAAIAPAIAEQHKSTATAVDISMVAAANVSSNAKRLRKRHSKRHSNWYDYPNFNENSTMLEWANPCGGYYVPPEAMGNTGRRAKRTTTKQLYNILKKSADNQFKTLNGGQQEIDISKIEMWSLHDYTYKFLPKLKPNSSIALKRWYRNMQTYVASFAYLRRIQLKWDHSKSQRESRIARELKDLLLSSRSMLCELEMAVNNTHPYRPQAKKLPQITRLQMNKRLKLRTKRRVERNPGNLQEADTIDLKFVKHYYYEFLRSMWKVLRRITKRKGQIAAPTERKEFNEVEKQNGSLAAGRRTPKTGRRRTPSWRSLHSDKSQT